MDVEEKNQLSSLMLNQRILNILLVVSERGVIILRK